MVDLITLLENGTLSECDESILLEAEYDIAVMRAEKEYLYEAGLASIDTMFNESGDEKQDSAFKKFLEKVFNAATKVIQGVLSAISNLFKKEHITEEDFMDSDAHVIMLTNDIEGLSNKVDEEMRKGSKLIQRLSKGLHVPDTEIDNFIKSANSVMKNKKTSNVTKIDMAMIPYEVLKGKVTAPLEQREKDMKVLYDTCIKQIEDSRRAKENQEKARKVYMAASKMSTDFAGTMLSVSKQIVSKQPDANKKKSKKKD